MTDTKERIKKIGSYFKGMNIIPEEDTTIVYVIVQFPPKWSIDNTIQEKFNVTVQPGKQRGEFYFASEMDDEELLFDSIDYTISRMEEIIERSQLLTAKKEELENLYKDENISIEKLRTLKFSFDEELIITETPKSSKKGKSEPTNNENKELAE